MTTPRRSSISRVTQPDCPVRHAVPPVRVRQAATRNLFIGAACRERGTSLEMLAQISSAPREMASGVSAALPTTKFVDMDFTAMGARGVLEAVRSRDPAAPFAYVVTPNVDHVVRLQRNRSDLWPAYRNAWMILCDSRILARLAHRFRFSLQVLPGSDLTSQMIRTVIEPGDRVAIVGCPPADIEELARRFNLRNVCHYNPPMGFAHNPVEVAKAVRFVITSRPRYTFLAVGSPQQEILAYRILKAGGATGVGFCVGASLDFLTGAQARAPAIIQRMSLEWLYRLQSDPRRLWRRYLFDGPGILRIARHWNGRRLQ